MKGAGRGDALKGDAQNPRTTERSKKEEEMNKTEKLLKD